MTSFRRWFLLLLVATISVAFVAMVRDFLLTVLMAALFTGVAYPVYRRILRRIGGRETLAALATLLLLLTVVIVPLLAVLGAVASEAQRVNETILPRLRLLVDEPGEFDRRLGPLPGYRLIEPYRAQIVAKATACSSSTR
jgi:predicted PurR-regulated permease PerM